MNTDDEDMTPEEYMRMAERAESVEIRTPVGGPVFRCGPWVHVRQRTWGTPVSLDSTNHPFRPGTYAATTRVMHLEWSPK